MQQLHTTTSTDYNTIRGNITGVVIHIVDGDTLDLDINNGTMTRIRFSLVNTPELGEPGYKEAKDFVQQRLLLNILQSLTQTMGKN